MSVEAVQPVRQYDFKRGPNYTDSVFSLAEDELAQSDNMYWQGGLRIVPGASKLVTTALGGAVQGLYQYKKKDGTTKFLMAADATGKLSQRTSGNWSTVYSTYTSGAQYYSWAVFKDTLIIANGTDAVKKWGGGAGAFASLGGSPPSFKYVVTQSDYVHGMGHTAQPSQDRFSDTDLQETWPSGNTLFIGVDDGEIISGATRWGDNTLVAKSHSWWFIEGSTPLTYSSLPTLSRLGTRSPNSIRWTDYGVFYWSEAGPAIFDGIRTILLTHRMRSILDTVDWTAPEKVSAAYDPYWRRVFVTYPRTGQTNPDRSLLIDLWTMDQQNQDVVFWPILFGFNSLATFDDANGRRRIIGGTSDGYVLQLDSGTTWGGATITGRARSRIYNLGRPDQVVGARTLDFWNSTLAGTCAVRYAVDGASTFTTHAQTISFANAGKTTKFNRLDGDGSGHYIPARLLQIELTNTTTTGFNTLGWEVGLEPRRRGAGSGATDV